jgi:hypothetical protein
VFEARHAGKVDPSSFIGVGERNAKMNNFEDHLNRLLHRASCPTTTELGEYQLKLLPKQRSAEIREHISQCLHCTRELEQLRAFMKEVSPDLEYSLLENIRIWVAERLTDLSSGGQFAPAYSLRGQQSEALVYSAGEAELTLEIAPASQGSDLRSILGLLTGVDPSDVDVILLQSGKLLVSSEVDELGNFILPDLESGDYTLILAGEEFEIHVEQLRI